MATHFDWDDGQQLVRKLADAVAGVLLTYGIISSEALVVVAGALAGMFSVGWWYYWNRTRPAAPEMEVAKADAS